MQIDYPFVAVDWGTSRMRAMLCASPERGFVSKLEGEGVAYLRESPADTLLRAIEPWTREHGNLDLLLGGMAGSDMGWRAASYLTCPLEVGELANGLLEFTESGHRIAIVPGVSGTNWLGQPDVMRGEEIQVLGWTTCNRQPTDAVLCLPGTHTKWVSVRDGRIEKLMTSVTGELYAVLKRHSVLLPRLEGQSSDFDAEAFAKGVDVAVRNDGQLIHTLFSTRSQALRDPAFAQSASSYLSGLLIGSDVLSATNVIEEASGAAELIGARPLCERFAMAMEQLGVKNNMSDGNEMVYAGFLAIAEASR